MERVLDNYGRPYEYSHDCGCGKPLYKVIDLDGSHLGVTHLGEGDEEWHYGKTRPLPTYSFIELTKMLKDCSSKEETKALEYLLLKEGERFCSEHRKFLTDLLGLNMNIYY